MTVPSYKAIAFVFWQKNEAKKFFQLALGNESPGPVEHENVVHSAIDVLMMILQGVKVSDQLIKHKSFNPVPGIRGWNHSACRHP